MRILHISDLHFGNDRDHTEKEKRHNCLNLLLQCLAEYSQSYKIDYLVISGDIAWSSTENEYNDALQFMNKLCDLLGVEKNRLVICPGNHDINRSTAEILQTPSSFAHANKIFKIENLELLSKPFEQYESFCDKLGLERMKIRSGDKGSHLIGVKSYDNVDFVILNSAWVAKNDEVAKEMVLGNNFIESIIANKLINTDKLVITVFHHPADSLADFEHYTYIDNQNSYKKITSFSNLLLCGHTHETKIKPKLLDKNKYSIACGSTYSNNIYKNSAVCYDFQDKQSFNMSIFSYDGEEWEKSSEVYYALSSEKEIEYKSVSVDHSKSYLIINELLNYVLGLSVPMYENLYDKIDDNILQCFYSMKTNHKINLTNEDKALLLLLVNTEAAQAVINYHFPSRNQEHLTKFVDEATSVADYRKICLAISLSQLIGENWNEYYQFILDNPHKIYTHLMWGEYTNIQYREALRNSYSTSIFQIKMMGSQYKLMENVFRTLNRCVDDIELCLIHPCICSTKILSSLESHYRVPRFLQGKYIITEDKSYYLDQIRRILTILNNLEYFSLINYRYGINLIINLFKDNYPGMGIQTIDNLGFIHLFPDCLPLNKPKFRFAIELKSHEFLKNFISEIKFRMKKKLIHVETFSLDSKSYLDLKERVQQELSVYFSSKDIDYDFIRPYLIEIADKVDRDVNDVDNFIKECFSISR